VNGLMVLSNIFHTAVHSLAQNYSVVAGKSPRAFGTISSFIALLLWHDDCCFVRVD